MNMRYIFSLEHNRDKSDKDAKFCISSTKVQSCIIFSVTARCEKNFCGDLQSLRKIGGVAGVGWYYQLAENIQAELNKICAET